MCRTLFLIIQNLSGNLFDSHRQISWENKFCIGSVRYVTCKCKHDAFVGSIPLTRFQSWRDQVTQCRHKNVLKIR